MPKKPILMSMTCALLLAGCYNSQPVAAPQPAVSEEVPREAIDITAVSEEVARERKIEEIRQSDPALNWVNIGISTGKFSESLSTSVYRTYRECREKSWSEDNECVPIPALPDSYWNAEKSHD